MVAIVAASALIVTTTSQWAQRDTMRPRGKTEEVLRRERQMWRAKQQMPFFSVVKRPANLAPLGDDYKPNIPGARARQDLIETPSGWVDLKAPQAFLDRLPGELRGGGEGSVTARGKWKMTGKGVNILQIDRGALADRGYGAIEAAVKATGARVLGTMPSRGMKVRAGSPEIIQALGELPFVEAAHEFAPGMKVFANTGKMALAEQRRALDPNKMKLRVQLWVDSPKELARRQIEKIVGKPSVEYSLNGSTFVVMANRGMARRIARNQHVASISEASEFVLANERIPTILMVGNTYNFGNIRPYQDAGIDGGGIDTNDDGVRNNVNNNPDEVPPQIVAVTDNGITYDAVHFAHTATQPAIPIIAPIGPSHRKVHALQPVRVGGTIVDPSFETCDSVLSGSGTHGNVVAGIIAGNPGELGFTYNLSDDRRGEGCPDHHAGRRRFDGLPQHRDERAWRQRVPGFPHGSPEPGDLSEDGAVGRTVRHPHRRRGRGPPAGHAVRHPELGQHPAKRRGAQRKLYRGVSRDRQVPDEQPGLHGLRPGRQQRAARGRPLGHPPLARPVQRLGVR
jgi:hypothetical protein